MLGHANVKCNLRMWLQTSQERPFTTKLFREADCAIYIIDVTEDVDKTKERLEQLKHMINNECSKNFVHILAGNKIDL